MLVKFRIMIRNLKRDIYVGERKNYNLFGMGVSCLFVSILMLMFVFINIKDGILGSVITSLIMFITMAVAAVFGLVLKNRKACNFLATMAVVVMCTLYVLRGTSSGFAILWAAIIPIGTMYFVSVPVGIYVSFYFGILMCVCFYTPLRSHFAAFYTDLFMTRFPILYFCIFLVTSIAMIQYHNNVLEHLDYDNKLSEEVKLQTSVADAKRRQISKMSLETMRTLANTIDAKDTYTNRHSYRVSELAVTLGKAIGMDEKQISRLRYDALVHDIGKIGIPDKILNKPDKLTDEEFDVIKAHTLTGYQVFEDAEAFGSAKLVARHHHERFDGSGYPDQLKGESIPINARIVCIADSYDAMTSDRIYRKALSPEKVRSELVDGSGTQFDPALVKVFLKLLDEGKLES